MRQLTQADPVSTTSQYPCGPSFCPHRPLSARPGHRCSAGLVERCPLGDTQFLGSEDLRPTCHQGQLVTPRVPPGPFRTGAAWSRSSKAMNPLRWGARCFSCPLTYIGLSCKSRRQGSMLEPQWQTEAYLGSCEKPGIILLKKERKKISTRKDAEESEPWCNPAGNSV